MKTSIQDLGPGYELPSVTKTLTGEGIKGFSNWSGKGIHTDEEFAKSVGFPKLVAQALMSYAYLLEVLTNFFGEDWVKSGKMNASFIKPVFVEDVISTKVVVKSKEVEGSVIKVNLDVSCLNQNGDLTTVGGASVSVGRND